METKIIFRRQNENILFKERIVTGHANVEYIRECQVKALFFIDVSSHPL